jgi:tetratricopeptide (TPR) repeat protein
MSARCAVCSAEYPSAQGFHRRPVGKGRFEQLCPGCTSRQEEGTFLFALALSTGMTVLGLICFSNLTTSSSLVFFGSLLLTFVVTILPHELAHALAALITGQRLFTVTLGSSGRILSVGQIFGYDIVIHRILLGGSVLYSPKNLYHARLRHFIVVLAGPMADVLLIVLAIFYLNRVAREGIFYYMLGGFIWGNIIQLAINLFPRKVRMGYNYIPSDGLNLLKTPFMSRATIEAWHSTTFYYEALESLQRDNIQDAEQWLQRGMEAYPNNSWGLLVEAGILEHKRQYREARDVCLRVFSQPALAPEIQAYLWCAIARLDLIIAEPALLEEADRFSLQAIEELPWESSYKGTRGSVLIELGRLDEGVRFTQQAFQENCEVSFKAINACYLAIAEVKLGDKSTALKWIDEAKKHDLNCPLIERAVKEIELSLCK